ncbi:MAG TPA: polyprenyl synthetase family protein [Polyangiales bacterium]|nr:polyprenyl synthetase family protein [Polyangiales bacterium]
MSSERAALVKQVLAEYGDLVRVRMRERLGEPSLPGDLRELTAEYPSRGGRTLRAGLCLATAQAFGSSAEDGLESAVSLELLHNAFLVHDDIEDESEHRRGLATLHRLHGVAAALNAGDALAVLGLSPLLDNCSTLGPRVGMAILREAQSMTRETVEGQALELAWRRHNQIDLVPADYLRMVFKKTCWYTTIYPCRVGAIIGSRDEISREAYVAFGFFLGAAFQIQDDLLNLIGERRSYGKELNGDLLEGKRTLMLIHLLQQSTSRERAKIQRFLAQPRRTRSAAQVRWLREALFDHGSIDYA